MQHITQTSRWGELSQMVARHEAMKIPLRSLKKCWNCKTRIKEGDKCNYCTEQFKHEEEGMEKMRYLIRLSSWVLDSDRAIRRPSLQGKNLQKPIDHCYVCGINPKGSGGKALGSNYLTYGDKIYCKNCKLKGLVDCA